MQRRWTWRHWTSFLSKPWYSFIRAVSANRICWPVLPIVSLLTSNPVLSDLPESAIGIYEYVEYLQGSTNSSTSAFDTATQRAGVCRDFAHLGIALCRALGIPARVVSGYAYGLNPPDFHAYFEAFLGGRWIIADPTRLSPQSSFVRIGQGRDAADTSFATIFGNVTLLEMQLCNEMATAGSSPPLYVKGPISNCSA